MIHAMTRLAARLVGLARAGLRGELRRRLMEDRDLATILRSDRFDRDDYLRRYPDVAAAGIDPVVHYVRHGAREGRTPHPAFETRRYLAAHPDMARSGRNPFAHCIRTGGELVPSPLPAKSEIRHEDILGWRMDLEAGAIRDSRFTGTIGVFAHLHYEEIAEEFAPLLARSPYPVKVYASTTDTAKKAVIEASFAACGLAAEVRVLPNRGRDIAPFLLGFAEDIRHHDVCLRLHSKKSTHHPGDFGDRWRWHLCSELIGDADRIRLAADSFATHPDLGILMGHHWPNIREWVTIGSNWRWMSILLRRIGLSLEREQEIEFPSGSMFWFRGAALEPLLRLGLDWSDFSGCEEMDRDAGIAHAIERALLFFAAKAGYRWAFLPSRRELVLDIGQTMDILRDSGEFDAAWYLARNPDVAAAGQDALEHFAAHGWCEGRDPSPNFSSRYYARAIARTAGADVNPLLHYVLRGKAEGLPTKPPAVLPGRIEVSDHYAAYKRANLNPDYEEESFPVIPPRTVKAIAFYFPQFHPFPDNDRIWGRGFTEWTNTTKALPLFEGHWQPRLPGELGFYDTRLKAVLARQIELAKQYGLFGFCFHHYFFEGRPVMRAPYDLMLANPDLDIPFCLHWANEPWTRRWDGLTDKAGMLLDQRHSPEDDLAFFADILPALRDHRYITVEGRPVLVIYRPGLFPDMAATIGRWRDCARRAGLKDLFLVVMQTGFEGRVDPRAYGFDAAIEYPPHNLGLTPCMDSVRLYDPDFQGRIYDYGEAMERALARPRPDYPLFRGIMPDWDCTPRRSNPDIFVNSSPQAYERWMEGLCRYSEEHLPPDRRFVFINAWNEWAEGAYLEPDRRHGYAYLGATARALAAPKRAKKIMLHIGMHKTGTTSFQHFMADYRREIMERFDVDYFTGMLSPPKHYEMHVAALRPERMTPYRDKHMPVIPDGFAERVAGEVRDFIDASPCATVVFSAEGLSYARHDDEIDRLRAMFVGHDVTVVACLRAPADFLRSYRNMLRATDLAESDERDSFAYVGADSWLTDHAALLAAYGRGFGKVLTFRYEDEMAGHGNTIVPYLKLLGIDPAHFPDIDRYFLARSPPP